MRHQGILYASALLSLSSLAAARTVVIGDSLLSAASPIPYILSNLAGFPLENYALVGAALQEGDIKSIPAQWASVQKGGIKTVIMSGGGNDVMSSLGHCVNFDQECRSMIDRASDILAKLLGQMKADGVESVIFLGYYDIQGLRLALNWGTRKMRNVCEAAPLKCIYVDPKDTRIEISEDGLHPTANGYNTLANLIWKAKNQNNIPFYSGAPSANLRRA